MRLRFYINNSEPEKVDKDITEVGSMTGTLREETSVMNPTFRVQLTVDNVSFLNYIYVEEWNRYYFVNDVKSVRNGLWDFSCHVDVLSTYKSQIRQLSCILARQENVYNLYLDDDKFLVDSKRMYLTKAFPNRVQTGGKSFIFTIAGGVEETQTT